MLSWIFPPFLLAVWFLWVYACAVGRAADGARRGIPEGKRGGTSIFPFIPVFPLAFWGIAWVIDRIASPWGTVGVGAAHVVFAGVLVVTIVRDLRDIRSIDGPQT